MKYKNFKWKFANSASILLVISCALIMGMMILLMIIIKDYKSIPLIIITFGLVLAPIYLVFLLIGDILYHKTKLSITDEGIYQNKRLLKYDNIRIIQYSKMLTIYSFEIKPIKDGVFVSKKILLYFYSLEEVYHFIISHRFSYLLSLDYQYYAIANFIKQIINQYGEDLHPDFVEFFNDHKKKCECCGNNTVFKRMSNDICPVCFWKDDKTIIFNPSIISDVNKISLSNATRNYNEYGACKEEYKDKVRKPFSYEKS